MIVSLTGLVLGLAFFFTCSAIHEQSELVLADESESTMIWTTKSMGSTIAIRSIFTLLFMFLGIGLFLATVSLRREDDDAWYFSLLGFLGCLGGILVFTIFWPVGEQLTIDYYTSQIVKEDRYLLPRPVAQGSVSFVEIDHVVFIYGEQVQQGIDLPGQIITVPYGIVKIVKRDGSYFKLHSGGFESRQLAEEVSEAINKPLEIMQQNL
ncbi:hypothetical protein ACFLVC_00065 [Chloroflexota bacterium]